MYLILPTEEAMKRNAQEAKVRRCDGSTLYWWAMIDVDDENTALCVEDGNGLTDSELNKCVQNLPE